MKKICLLLICFLVLPIAVHAVAYSETFEVGDSVYVDLYGTGEKVAFHVLKYSGPGEEKVRLLFDGSFNNGGVPFDEPKDDHEATTELERAYVYNRMGEYVSEHDWHFDSIGLLTEEDLTNLGIKSPYQITNSNKWLAPTKVDVEGILPEDYNYWTQIKASDTSVYCMTFNEEWTNENDIYSTLVAKAVENDVNNPKCAIRPVIVVDKSIILCNNNPKPTTTTTTKEKTTPKKSPDTGVTDYILPLTLVLLFAGSAFIVANKKSAFKKF